MYIYPVVYRIITPYQVVLQTILLIHDVCMYGHTYSKSMDQPSKAVNPARGQLNKENETSLSAFALENLVSRDGFDSPVPRQSPHLHTQAES